MRQNPKELLTEIYISEGSGGGKQSPRPNIGNSILNRKKKPFHLPKFVKMLNPFRYMESFKNLSRSQSPKLVLEGPPHNPNDEKLVDSFRELLSLDGQLQSKHFDDHTLLRFLRKRDFDLTKAKDTFMRYIKWREEFRVDSISKEFKYEECQEVKKCYPHGFHGVDRYGRPVYIARIGMVDFNMFLQVTTAERFMKHHVCEQEKTQNWRYPSCSLASKKHIASTLSILDVKDVGMSQFSNPARNIFMETQKIDSDYYPDTLHQLYIINAGPKFKVLWKAMRAFIDARTLAKIRVLGSNYKKSLMEVIEPSNLPSFLGGECTCSESGGCMFSDKGPWNDPKISEMLYNREENASNRRGVCSEENAGHNDSCDVTLQTENVQNYVDKHLLQKIEAFEPVIEDTKKKIRMLETALEDIKLVLQGVAQHIAELKKMNVNSIK